MPEFLDKQSFMAKIFDYENNTEWKFQGDKPAIIDFYADWCGPCKMVEPIMEELANEYAGLVDIFKIDTDKQQELAGLFQIRSIPSVLFIPVDGKPRMAIGAMPKEGYVSAIKDIFSVELAEKN
jgi:thioredoxin